MDDLSAERGFGSELPANAPPQPQTRGPGRPSQTPEQRAASDARYKAILDLMDAMPAAAKEPKFAVFPARNRSDAKADFRPLFKMQVSKWKDDGFMDEGALSAFLEEKYGPGRYLIEPQDEHGQRMTKLPFWVVATSNLEDDMDDFDDDDYDDRPRRRRRDDDDDRGPEPREKRANLADMLVTASRADREVAQSASKTQGDIMSLMVMSSQEQARQSREEAIRREELRREQEREDRKREEDRRRDEDKKRDDERIRREEDYRREQTRLESEREVRRAEEQRRRDEDNRRWEAEQRRRDQEMLTAQQAGTKRLEIMLGLATAALPIVERMMNRTNPLEQALLRDATTKKDTDPITALLLKFVMDKREDSPNMIIQTLVEATKAGSMIQSEQMKQAFAMNAEVTKAIIGKALEMAENGGGGGGKSTFESILGAIQGAADIVSKLTPAASTAPPAAYAQAARARIQAPVAAPAPTAPATATAQPAPAPGQQPQQQPTAEQIEEERKFQEAVRINPVLGVLSTLYLIQTNQYNNQQEYQALVQHAIQTMPLDVRVAILDGNETHLLGLCMPTIQSWPLLAQWAPGALGWFRTFVPQLVPSIEAIHGPVAQQREAYVAELAKRSQAQEAANQAQAELAAQATQADVMAPPAEAAAPAEAPVEAPAGGPVEDSNVIPGPGSDAPATSAPVSDGAPASHLDV